jgi:hypothetical protein
MSLPLNGSVAEGDYYKFTISPYEITAILL